MIRYGRNDSLIVNDLHLPKEYRQEMLDTFKRLSVIAYWRIEEVSDLRTISDGL
jgi:hypothetical protein